jgi:hypothetical protein
VAVMRVGLWGILAFADGFRCGGRFFKAEDREGTEKNLRASGYGGSSVPTGAS